jgi:F-type H+-transporting ATPase subunit b
MRVFFLIAASYLAAESYLLAAEAGMPQLDPKYWASQAFWLVLIFTSLYLMISKVFIPKIKNGLDDRDEKIKNDLDDARNLNDQAEEKLKEYEVTIENAKKEVQKIMIESKNKLNSDLQTKRNNFDKEIKKIIEEAQKEILDLKKGSVNDINKISEEMTLKIIENISGDKLNESSVKAAIIDVSKNNLEKYL